MVVCTPLQGRIYSALSEPQKRDFLIIIYLHIRYQQLIAIPHNRSTDDADHIPTDPASQKSSKKTLPEPAPIPDYKPLNIDDFTNRISNLPPYVTSHQPYEIFSLFFSEEQLQKLTDHTNAHANRVIEEEKAEKVEKLWSRTWIPTTIKELRAYIGVYIYIGLNPKIHIKAF